MVVSVKLWVLCILGPCMRDAIILSPVAPTCGMAYMAVSNTRGPLLRVPIIRDSMGHISGPY